MGTDRYERANEIFASALEHSEAERGAYLDSACGDDRGLREEVESLLALASSHGGSDAPLEQAIVRAAVEVSSDRIASEPIPERIGGHRILRLIAHGGMGVVYEAEQESPRRRVALKLMRPGSAGARLLRRLEHEAELLGRLQHPGIAQVYEAGTAETEAGPQPFFAMELVRGRPLDEACRDLPLRERVSLLAATCDAVQHAHQKGVIHRDLKPANILVDEEGRPKVLDFGIAKATDADVRSATLQTEAGQVLGTLAYMSPEQLTGDASRLDTRSDVYALGVTAHEVLTGVLPGARGRQALPEAIQSLQQDVSRQVSVELPADLRTVLRKALEHDPERRYATVAELAADLRRFQRHEPVHARPPSVGYLLRSWLRRHAVLVAVATLAIAALVAGTVVSVAFAIRSARERDDARRQTYRAELALAEAAWREQDAGRAWVRLDAAPEELRGFEWGWLRRQLDESEQVFGAERGPPIAAVSADGEVLTVVQGMDRSTNRRRWFRWRTRDGVLLHRSEELSAYGHALSTDGRLLAVGSANAVARVHDLDAGREYGALAEPIAETLEIRPLGFAPDGQWYLYMLPDTEYSELVIDTVGPERVRIATWIDPDTVNAASVDPTGTRVALAGETGRAWIRVVATAEQSVEMIGHEDQATAIAWNEDGTQVFSAGLDSTIRAWDASTGEQRAEMHVDSLNARSILPVNGGSVVLSAGDDGAIRSWDVATGELLDVWLGHRSGAVLLARRGDVVVSGSLDGEVRTWRLDGTTGDGRLGGHESYVYGVAFAPDGSRVATVGWDDTLRVWSVAERRELAQLDLGMSDLTSDETPVRDVTWSRDGRTIAALAGRYHPDMRIRTWDADTGELLEMLVGQEVGRFCLEFTPDSRSIVAPLVHGGLRTWELGSGRAPEAHETSDEVVHLAFDATGNRMVSGSLHGIVRLHDLPGYTIRWEVEAHGATVNRVAWSPDGRLVASADSWGTIRVSRSSDGALMAELSGHVGEVFTVAFSPDGRRLASGGRDGIVRLWDLERHVELLQLRGHQEYVFDLAFSPDGLDLLSASGDHDVRLWSARPR